jgi:DNA topoisomerase VI subunit B
MQYGLRRAANTFSHAPPLEVRNLGFAGIPFRDGHNQETSIQTLRFCNRVAAIFATVACLAQGVGEQVAARVSKTSRFQAGVRELA